MVSLMKNISELSKYPLRVSYRLVHNTINNKQVEPAVQQEKTDNDLPISLNQNPFEREKKLCILCRLNIEPDWKNVRMLSQFQSSYTGKIYGKHITGLCTNKQKAVEREIDKAQQGGFMPQYHKNPLYIHDPKLFNPDNPFRPHKY